jgi:hypothetical protein
MRKILVTFCLAAGVFAGSAQFNEKGELLRPESYREWVFLSSGLGMTYGPSAARPGQDPRFDNVFASPEAYRSFLANGVWPDGTILVLEVRNSRSKGSINQDGHYQSDLLAIEAEVKTAGKWSFYDFSNNASKGRLLPRTERCYSCHGQNGAVDNTFVQFYPTLLPVAKAKGTVKVSAE